MKTHMTWSLVPRLSALAIALSAMTGCSDTPESGTAEARTAYVASVRQAAGDQRAYIGTVRATQRGQLSFPVSGKVSAVLVEPGDVVRKGQVLARLDPVPLQRRRRPLPATSHARRPHWTRSSDASSDWMLRRRLMRSARRR